MRQNARFIRKLPIPMEIKKEFPCLNGSPPRAWPGWRRCAPFWMAGTDG